jgi:hypothetical protein
MGSQALGEIEGVLRVIGGSGPGRRSVTLQLCHAYVLLLAAWFQGFARALHTETAVVIARGVHDPRYKALLVGCLTHERRLDRGNAHVDALARDFGRFGLELWRRVDERDARGPERKEQLGGVMRWRNAIAHHDVDEKLAVGNLIPATIDLATCRTWCSALDGLATTLDRVAADQCEALGIARPW